MRFFGLSTCDTCRKALRELRAAGIDPVVTDVRKDGIDATDRAAILAAFGEGAVNRASATWRALGAEERSLSPDALIAAHPTLLKRPVIEVGGRWYQGWTEAVRTAVLG